MKHAVPAFHAVKKQNINKMIDKMISDGKVGSQDIEIIEIKQA